jgi:Protein of unknown function (DUF429)
MTQCVIGIDCAVDPKSVAVASGLLSGDRLTLRDVKLCSSDCLPGPTAAQYARGRNDVLFTLDAPLGWPQALGPALSRHEAGRPLEPSANRLFRRETDGFIRKNIGKQSLDVGADRIARTAKDALDLLQSLGGYIGIPVELAWHESDRGPRAIEVYPAATLKAHGIRASKYKKPNEVDARRTILNSLRERMDIEGDGQILLSSSHALDAAVCVLAGADFLRGLSFRPTDLLTSRKEGWIWVRDPRLQPVCNPADRADEYRATARSRRSSA